MPWDPIKLNDGRKIPGIAFGTWTLGNGQGPVDQIEQALENGFDHIDTAQGYRNENEVGKAIADSGLAREDLWITSKFSGRDNLSITESLHESLKQTGLKYLDLYLIHHPRLAQADPIKAWREMVDLQAAGFTKSVGVSNYEIADLEKLKEGKVLPAVNQIMLHPYVWAKQKALVEYCHDHGIVVEAYSALIPITRLPGGPLDAVLEKIGKRTGATWDQILLAWVRAKGAVAVTMSSKRSRLLGYLAAGDLLITDEEIAELDSAGVKGGSSSHVVWSKNIARAVLTLAGVYTLSRLVQVVMA